MDQGRARREAELAAHLATHQQSQAYPSVSAEARVSVPCLVPALCNERLPKDFKAPRKVPNYTAHQPLEA